MAMRVRPDRLAYQTGVVTEHLYPTSQMLSEITGVAVQPNKAIIGRNAFAHEAGIHQDGMLKNPLTYEIMTPQSVGVPDSTLVLGKHSGRHALGLRCEQLGFHFDRQKLDVIYRAFVVLADQIKHVEDHHLLKLIDSTHDKAAAPTEVAFAAVAGAGSRKKSEQSRAAFPVPLPVPRDFNIASLAINAAESHGEQEDYFWGV
jgi:2-isopropylmalate synthase